MKILKGLVHHLLSMLFHTQNTCVHLQYTNEDISVSVETTTLSLQ